MKKETSHAQQLQGSQTNDVKREAISFQSSIAALSSIIPNFDFSSFYDEHTEFKSKIEAISKEFNDYKLLKEKNRFIEESNLRGNFKLNNKGNDNNHPKDEEILFSSLRKINQGENVTNDVIIEMINAIQEHLKIVGVNLTQKANKEDLDRLTKHIFSELDKSSLKITEYLAKVDSKIKSLSSNDSISLDKDEIVYDYFIKF